MRLSALLFVMCIPTALADVRVEKLSDGVFWLPGIFVPGRQPDGNSILFRGDQGWVVVDSGRHREHTQRILDFVQTSGEPITDIVNTHWHLDHIGGNTLLKRRYPEARTHASMAIAGALEGFLAHYRSELETQIAATEDPDSRAAWQAEIRIIDAGKALYPDQPVTRSRRISLSGRKLRMYLVDRAVTEGDVWLYDRATHTLVAGDLVTLPVPFLDTACPSRWLLALKQLQRSRFDRLIPGHGAPMTRDGLARYSLGFERLLSCAATDAPALQCGNDWIENLGDLIPANEQKFALDLLDYYVSQVLRAEPGVIANRCRAIE